MARFADSRIDFPRTTCYRQVVPSAPVKAEFSDPDADLDLSALDRLDRIGGHAGFSGASSGGNTLQQDIARSSGVGVVADRGNATGHPGGSSQQGQVQRNQYSQTLSQGGPHYDPNSKLELDTELMKRFVPAYHRWIDRQLKKAAKLSDPYAKAISDLRKVQQKIKDSQSFTGQLAAFFSNPLQLIETAIGAVATSGASLGVQLASTAITAAQSDPDKAIRLIDTQISKLTAQIAHVDAHHPVPLRFDQMPNPPLGTSWSRASGKVDGGYNKFPGTAPVPKQFLQFVKAITE